MKGGPTHAFKKISAFQNLPFAILKRLEIRLQPTPMTFQLHQRPARKKIEKTMAKPKNVDLDQCVIKWYQQQRGSGVMVRGTELKMAAERFANNIGHHEFKASEGWLYRFKLRHGLTGKKVYGESYTTSTLYVS